MVLRIKCVMVVLLAAAMSAMGQVSTQTEISTSKQSELNRPGYYFYAKPFEVTMTVNLWGEVPQQGIYVLSTNTDIVQLISYAGGPTSKSDLEEVLVYRSSAKKDVKMRTLKKINVRDILEGRAEPLPLGPGDMIVVRRLPDATTFTEILTVVNASATLLVLGITIYNTFK